MTLQIKQNKSLVTRWWFLLGLVAAAITFWLWARLDLRYVPEDIKTYGVVNGRDAVVKGIVWQEVGSVFKPDERWVSFVVLVENQGSEDLHIFRTQITVRESTGEVDAQIWPLGAPGIVLLAGESLSFWAGGISLPDDHRARVNWSEVEIQLSASLLGEHSECYIVRSYDVDIYEAGYDADGVYRIAGRDKNELFFSEVHLSFFNDSGEFIGRSTIFVNEDNTFEKEFAPNAIPKGGPGHYIIQGEIIKGKIASYQVHFVEGSTRECP
jgi:hypothetical protein